MWKYIPLILFFGLLGFLARGLDLDPSELPSPLIDKPAPQFNLPLLHTDAAVSNEAFAGDVWLLNVWASWCRACVTEHPELEKLNAIEGLTMVGLNYKDIREDGIAWLDRFGNPFDEVLFDQQGGTGIDYGVYGVPETFIMDKQGNIRYKHIGPISPEDLKNKVVPLIEMLKAEQV